VRRRWQYTSARVRARPRALDAGSASAASAIPVAPDGATAPPEAKPQSARGRPQTLSWIWQGGGEHTLCLAAHVLGGDRGSSLWCLARTSRLPGKRTQAENRRQQESEPWFSRGRDGPPRLAAHRLLHRLKSPALRFPPAIEGRRRRLGVVWLAGRAGHPARWAPQPRRVSRAACQRASERAECGLGCEPASCDRQPAGWQGGRAARRRSGTETVGCRQATRNGGRTQGSKCRPVTPRSGWQRWGGTWCRTGPNLTPSVKVAKRNISLQMRNQTNQRSRLSHEGSIVTGLGTLVTWHAETGRGRARRT